MNQHRTPDDKDDAYQYRMQDDRYLMHQETIGMLIKRLRTMNHSTQSDLAVQTGTDPSHLSKIERGDSNIKLVTIMQLCGGLEISGEKLLHMSGQIIYSAQLHEERSACNDEQGNCANENIDQYSNN